MIAGIGFALVSGPLGSLMLWRRLAFFGDTLAHSALSGVALGFALHMMPLVGVLIVSLTIAVTLGLIRHRTSISLDTLLAIISHSALAVGLIFFSVLKGVKLELSSYLFGEILAVNKNDILQIYIGGGCILAAIIMNWSKFLMISISEELAASTGIHVMRTRVLFMILMALTIAIALKIIGALLMTALLIIPAATSRIFSKSPEQMAFFGSVLSILAVILGIQGSLYTNTPTTPTIVVSALGIFIATIIIFNLTKRKN